ncbi:MAG: TolC family protein [Acidobacteriota bacterium]|nr:TolC family protein [Acidobacteriota bacterium]
MRRKSFGILCALVLALTAGGFGRAEEKTLPLTLDESIARALKKNFAVAAQVLEPQIAEMVLSRAEEKFIPSMSFAVNKRNTETASYSWIDAEGSVKTRYNRYSGQLSQAIPFGGTLNLSLDSYKNDTNQNFQTINPRFGSTLTFDFTQPLLKDFGFNMSRREIIVARNNLDISQSQLEQMIMDVVYSVEEAYWTLAYSIDNLEVRRQSLKLAQDLLDKNKRSVEVGTLAPIEILSAQAEVATREADILAAEAQVKNYEDKLKTIINLSEEEAKTYAAVIPKDVPNIVERQVNLEDALATALTNRPDLRASRIGLKNSQFSVSVAKNQLLPGLNLTASYWSPGLSGTRIIYAENNPLTGIILSRIPGAASSALKDATNFRYPNWSLGLTLSVPLSNVFSRAAYTQAKLDFQRASLNLKNQEQQLFLEIKNSVRAVETNYKRVQAYRVARELAEQKLTAEEEKLRVGLSTNYMVLQYQRDLANARTSELNAIVTYNISLGSLDKAMGVSLKNMNITVTDYWEEE